MEAANWVEANFPAPDAVKAWVRERRPELAEKLFPQSRELSPRLKEVQKKFLLPSVGKGIQNYLQQHPDVRGVFWGKGGGTFLRRNLHPMENRFLGLFVIDNRWDVMSQIGSYPGDVWQLAEDQTMEPLVHVDRLTVKGQRLECSSSGFRSPPAPPPYFWRLPIISRKTWRRFRFCGCFPSRCTFSASSSALNRRDSTGAGFSFRC